MAMLAVGNLLRSAARLGCVAGGAVRKYSNSVVLPSKWF